jgi:uncharacterized protein YjbJ (UPF0337 family)
MVEKDRLRGKVESIAERPKRPFADWVGDTTSQVEGGGQHVKGKIERTLGNAKNAAQDAKDDGQREIEESKAIHPVTSPGKVPS